MKQKIILIATAIFMLAVPGFAQKNLPASANAFIKEHFPNEKIVNNKMDDGKHKVYLSSGYELEFSSKGEMLEVEGKGNKIPNTIIPANIFNYININYSGQNVTEIEKEDYGYEIKLSNGTELKFDKAGKFMKIDD
jgi:hypothetical protein